MDRDSWIEGSFEDQIYFTKEGFRVSVECKDTEVGLNDSAFLIPFGLNLAEYVQVVPENRFSYDFCCRSMKNVKQAKAIFGKVRNMDEACKLLECVISALKQDSNDASKRAATVLEEADKEVVFSFFDRTEIVEGSYSDFERAALEWEYSRQSPFLQSLETKNRYIESFERASEPDDVSETLASNIFKVVSMPDSIYIAKTRFRVRKNLLNKIDYEADPFILKEKSLYTFSDLNDTENRLREVVSIDSIETKRINVVFSDDARQFWLTDLLNRCIIEYLYYRGLRRRGNRFVFVSYEKEEVTLPWNPGTGKNRRTFTKCKLRENGSVAYCVHKALTASFKFIGDEYFLLLEPCFYFSRDGSEPLSPRKMTQFSSRAWAHHGNDRLLYDLRFWMNFLCLGNEHFKIPTGGVSISIDSLYETSAAQFGIAGDRLSNTELLSRIHHGIPKVFRACPVKQTELGEFWEADDGGAMDLQTLEGFDHERD